MPRQEQPLLPTVESIPGLNGIDALLASIQQEATKAEQAAITAAQTAVAQKQQNRQESVQRVESLADFGATLTPESPLENYYYEATKGIFAAYQEEFGFPASDKISAAIDQLQKINETLQKVSSAPQNATLIVQLKTLKEKREQLFHFIKVETQKALEAIKGKYHGEETELAKRYQELQNSPLLRGAEQSPNTPEARVEALKQEILEVLFQPVITKRLQFTEKRIQDEIGKIAQLTTAFADYQKDYTRNPQSAMFISEFAGKNNIPNPQTINNLFTLQEKVGDIVKAQEQNIQRLEQSLQRDQLAFTTNQAIVEQVLTSEKNEVKLREALVELRDVLTVVRTAITTGRLPQDQHFNTAVRIANPLVQNILGHLVYYGAPMPAHTTETWEWSPIRQLVDIKQPNSQNHEYTDYLQKKLRRAWLETRLPEANRGYALTDGQFPLNPATVGGFANRNEKSGALAVLAAKEEKEGRPLTPEAVIRTVYQGEGAFLNLQKAHRAIDAGIMHQAPQHQPLSRELEQVGWRGARNGAWAEPDQELTGAQQQYDAFLEKFSAPQVESSRLFAPQNPDEKIVFYTLRQAEQLLQQAQQDANRIVKDIAQERAALEKDVQNRDQKINDLEIEIARLKKQAEQSATEATKREDTLNTKLKKAENKTSDQGTKIENLKQEKNALQEKLDAISQILNRALEKPFGIFENKVDFFKGVIEKALKKID